MVACKNFSQYQKGQAHQMVYFLAVSMQWNHCIHVYNEHILCSRVVVRKICCHTSPRCVLLGVMKNLRKKAAAVSILLDKFLFFLYTK